MIKNTNFSLLFLVGINHLRALALSLLSLEAVSVCVDDRIIVRDVSLSINPGELHVIMGLMVLVSRLS
jgi:ABC-type proline/glycine betaine transport system ATPase subunit